jgi:hypothetical protein
MAGMETSGQSDSTLRDRYSKSTTSEIFAVRLGVQSSAGIPFSYIPQSGPNRVNAIAHLLRETLCHFHVYFAQVHITRL